MRLQAYLIIGNGGAIRAVKSPPNLNYNEIAISIHLSIPDILFKKPAIYAEILIDEGDVRPTKITADLVNTVTDVLKSQGIELRIVQPENQ